MSDTDRAYARESDPLETKQVQLTIFYVIAADGWMCDSCGNVFGADDKNHGEDCDLCGSCADEARKEAPPVEEEMGNESEFGVLLAKVLIKVGVLRDMALTAPEVCHAALEFIGVDAAPSQELTRTESESNACPVCGDTEHNTAQKCARYNGN